MNVNYRLTKGKSWFFGAGLPLFLLLASCQPDPVSPQAQSWQRAVAWLWNQQEEDGGWHSSQHGIMRGGQAHTPFILFALLQVPDSIYQPSPKKISAGLAFIRRNINQSGAVGLTYPGIVEYPNYATSYALRVLQTWGEPFDQQFVQKMTHYLGGQQFDHSRGIDRDAPWFGAFGFGETNLSHGQIGHIDISHTRKVLEALELAGAPDSVFRQVRQFLAVMQKRPSPLKESTSKVAFSFDDRNSFDGGFFSSPNVSGANKGGVVFSGTDSACYRSYATATCDGILALLAAGYSTDSPEVKSALNWLEEHSGLRWAGGIPQQDPAQWHRVLVFYHWWVRSAVYNRLEVKGTWKKEIAGLLLHHQEPDGSFLNPEGARNKEDDPLLATAMAIMTWRNVFIDHDWGRVKTPKEHITLTNPGESYQYQVPR